MNNIELCIIFVDKMDGSFWECSGEERYFYTEFMAMWCDMLEDMLEDNGLDDVVVIVSSII